MYFAYTHSIATAVFFSIAM